VNAALGACGPLAEYTRRSSSLASQLAARLPPQNFLAGGVAFRVVHVQGDG
jgi:hypothetical protein